MPHPRIALFLDLDNAALAAVDLDLQHCSGVSLRIGPLVEHIERILGGTVEQRRAYGNVALFGGRALTSRVPDPRDIRALLALDADLQAQLAEHGFRVEHTPTRGGSGKNAADIALAIDAMEVAERSPHIDTIAVLSQDSDFAPLIQRLRARGRDVALVTVGPPNHAGMPALRNQSKWHVVYDQRLIDQAGFAHLDAVIAELRADSAAPLTAGVNLAAVKAAMLARVPSFTPGALGFASCRAFVEACVAKPLVVDDNGFLRLEAPKAARPAVRLPVVTAPAPAPVVAPAPVLAPAAVPASAPRPVRPQMPAPTRDVVLGAALRKASLHPRTEHRDAIVAALREAMNADDASATRPMWRETRDRLSAELGVSASAVGDSLCLLRRSGALTVESLPGETPETALVALAEAAEVDAAIVREACRTLFATGVLLDTTDAEPLAIALFGPRAVAMLRAVGEALGNERLAAK